MRGYRTISGGVRLAYRPEGPLPYDWDMVTAIRRQIDDPDPAWERDLGRISAPVLLIGGGPRSHVPPDGIAEMARRIPRSTTVTIPAGHLVHATRPRELTEAAVAFPRKGRVRGGAAATVREEPVREPPCGR